MFYSQRLFRLTYSFLHGYHPHAPTDADYKRKVVECDGRSFKLTIWDTAGQERFRTITLAYFRNCQGMLLVYDVTNRPSFENLRHWMEQILEHSNPGGEDDAPTPVIVLVGNKCDKEDQRVVSSDEGRKFAEEFEIPFIEASAKKPLNVNEAFMILTRDIAKKLPSDSSSMDDGRGAGHAQNLEKIRSRGKNDQCAC